MNIIEDKVNVPFEEVLTCLKSNPNIFLATRDRGILKKKFIYIQNGSMITPDQARNDILKLADEITILPHIDMIVISEEVTINKNPIKKANVMIGWVPTQDDMNASDWSIHKII